jgi:recombination protein RecR
MAPNDPFTHLIAQLMRLPGIGRKSAQRLAFHLLKMESGEARKIGQAIIDAKERIAFCSLCNNMADAALCVICKNPTRDTRKVLVVEEPSTLYAIERSGEYQGLYHVLLGSLSPLSQNGHADLSSQKLMDRLSKGGGEGGIGEVILAMPPTMEGEATALCLTRQIRPLGIRVTRIACGVPVGLDLEYVDEVTLAKSLEWRREM